MSVLESEIRKIVKEVIVELKGLQPSALPEFITIAECAEICRCDKTVINSLIDSCKTSGFPFTRLGSRTVRINKAHLVQWFNEGGSRGIGEKN